MTSYVKNVLNLGDDINLAPMLCLSNFYVWRQRMEVFLQAQDYEMWLIVKNGQVKAKNAKGALLDEKAKMWIMSSLDDGMKSRVSKCNQAKELWDFLENEYGESSSTNTLEIQGEEEDEQNDGMPSYLLKWQSMHDKLNVNLNILCMNNLASLKILDEISLELNVLQKCFNLISPSCVSKEEFLKEDDDLKCDSLFSSEHASVSSCDDFSDSSSIFEECAMLCLNDKLSTHDIISIDHLLLNHVDTNLKHVKNNCDTYVEDDMHRHVHNSHECQECPPHMSKCISCFYCGKNGHMSFECPTKRSVLNGAKTIWIVKGSRFNLHGPKRIWVPKSSIE